MYKHYFNNLTGIIASIILLFTSGSVSAAIISIDQETANSSEILQEIFSSGMMQSGHAYVEIQNLEQAKKSTEVLTKRFRQFGEIAAVNAFAPGIISYMPTDPTIHYLYAIALASAGNASAANDQVLAVKSSKKNRLLYLLAKASIARAEADYKTATSFSRKAIARDKTHPFAYNLLGQIAIAQKNYDGATKNFKLAIKFAPDYSAAHSNLASVQFLQNKFGKSLQSFSKSILLTPDYCPALIGRASVYLQLGDRASAINDLEICLTKYPEHAVAIKRLVALYLENGELIKAENQALASRKVVPVFSQLTLADIKLRRLDVDAARKILSGINVKSAQAHYLLSFCDMLDNKAKDALNQIKLAGLVKSSDSSALKLTSIIYALYDQQKINMKELVALQKDASIGPLAVFVTGNVYATQNDYTRAMQYWSQDRDLVPGFILNGLSLDQVKNASSADEQKFLSLGVLFYLKGYYSAAKIQFDQAIKINRDSFLANFFNGLTLTQSGKADKAVDYLLSSLNKAKGFFPANYMLAESYLKRGKVDKAIEFYKTAASSEPDQGVLVKLGLLYEGKGKTQEAANAYQTFINNYPQNFLGYNQLAWLYAKQGIKLDKAIELAMKSNKLRPGNASVNDTIGWIYFQQKKYKKSNEFLQNANAISKGKNPDILYHLAALQYKQGRLKAAKKNLEYALSLKGSFESMAKARKLLSEI